MTPTPEHLFIAGAASAVTGCALLAPWLAFVVGGVAACALALALKRAANPAPRGDDS